jgi:dihydrolipoamide dehydrogenase
MKKVDAIIIGSGQSGIPLAVDLAQQGQDVVLFERGALGGSCVNYGCTPSKTFLASAHAARQARPWCDLGLRVQVEVDFPAVMARVRGMINSFNEGVEQQIKDAGVKLVRADAFFVAERTVSGNGTTVQAPLVVINTGASPFIPDISGLADTPYLTSRNFWTLRELPRRILVLGGGYVGLELGQGIARLGSETHIIEKNERIISTEEKKVSETLTEALKADGLLLHHKTEVQQVAYRDEVFSLTLDNGRTLEGDALLVATGRKPNTTSLDVEAGHINLDERGYIKTDEHFRTSSEGVYAIGDVTGQPAFTHVSWEDYRRLQAILNGQKRRQGDRVLGYAFFTEPQVGRAGLTLAAAKAQGYQAKAVTMPLEQVARAVETGYKLGFYRMVIDEESGEILGATLVGPETAELIHVFITLMEAGSTWQRLEQSVHIHPTFAEALPSLARMCNE